MTTKSLDRRPRAPTIWLIVGLMLLAYAVIGNWLVLPGYRRFLAGGSPGEGGSGMDFVLIWGATRTILWMLSFHMGAFCIAWAGLRASRSATRQFRRWFTVGALGWVGLWTIPTLPGPFAAFFAGGGILTLLMISIAFGRAAMTGEAFADARGGHWRIASAFFFALATWDVCGLGSVGGILQPDSAARTANHALVVTQTTKLMIEFVIAWGLTAIAAVPSTAANRR